MNELQLKLERRRKSMADVESGARLDEAVSSQKNGPSGASATVSAAQKEMLDKLDRRRRLNEQGDLGDCNPSVTEPLEPVADALSSNEVGGADAVSKVSAIESGASSAAVSEIDSISYSSRRPPVPKVADKSHRPPPVPPEALPAPDITPLALNSPSQDNIFSSSSAAASIVLPWNSGIYTLRDRKTPEKADNSNTGLIEAQAKQHKRRQSFKIKALYEFNAEEALQQASIDTLMAIVNEFQLELGPGIEFLYFYVFHVNIYAVYFARRLSTCNSKNARPTSGRKIAIFECQHRYNV